MRFRNKTRSPNESRACQDGSFPILDDGDHNDHDDKIASLPTHSPAENTEFSPASVTAAVVVLKSRQAKNRNRNRIRGSFLNKLNQLKCSSRADPEDNHYTLSNHYGRRSQMMDDGDDKAYHEIDNDYNQGACGNFKWIEEPLPILEAPLVEFDTEELEDDSDYSHSHLDTNDDNSIGTLSCGMLLDNSMLSSDNDNDDPNDRQTIGIQPFCVTQQVEEQMKERERAAAAAATNTTADTAASTVPEGFHLDGEKTVSMGASDEGESSRGEPDDSSRPTRPRPYSLSSKVIAAPVVSVFSPNGAVLKETIYVEEQQSVESLEETSPNREHVTFRAQMARVLQETRRSSTNTTGVPVAVDVLVEEQEPSPIPDVSFVTSMDSSYNSKMHDLSFGPSTESMDMNDFSSDSSYDSSEIDDLGQPSIEEEDNDDDSLSALLATASPLRSDAKQKSGQFQEILRNKDDNNSYPRRDLISRPSSDRDLISRPSIDSSDCVGEQKSDKADDDWQALRNKEKQRLDLDKNQSDKQRLDLGKNQDATEWRKPPPHSNIPIYSARISHNTARTGVLESRSTQEKLKLTKPPAASSRMQELIGRFEHAASPRIKDLIGRFERQSVSRESETKSTIKPTLDIARKAQRSERENRQDVGISSFSSSSSADVSEFPARHPSTSPATHSFFWRSHPRVESSESKADKPSVSTVAFAKVDPHLVDTSRSADADSESYTVRVDSSFDSKHMTDHQPEPTILESVSSERRFL
jgi:hypothetical protein